MSPGERELWQKAASLEGMDAFLSFWGAKLGAACPARSGLGLFRCDTSGGRMVLLGGNGDLTRLHAATESDIQNGQLVPQFLDELFPTETSQPGDQRPMARLGPRGWPIPNSVLVPFSTLSGTRGLLVIMLKRAPQDLAPLESILTKMLGPLIAAFEIQSRMDEFQVMNSTMLAERESYSRKLGLVESNPEIVGVDSGLKLVMERVKLVAHSDLPVLILGETGTGKELVAKEIHQRSLNAKGPFIRVNCGAIPAELIDSHLFGHERGSFTGADRQRLGWFERANQGTLFLDEIGELPLEAQIRLLRVLQDGYLERVGGSDPIHINVRVVAATHRDLATMVSEKSFREDLWYRLAVFPIFLPPLRDRKFDIPPMVRRFLTRAANRFSLPPVAPNDAHFSLLAEYDWPGNIRELAAVIDRAVILGNGKSLEIEKALGIMPAKPSSTDPQRERTVPPTSPPAMESLDSAVRRHIERALQITRGRIEGKSGAAALLQINPNTLRGKMRKLGISRRSWQQPDD